MSEGVRRTRMLLMRGSSATRNPYYVAQRMIILGRTDALLDQFVKRLVGLEDDVAPEWVDHFIESGVPETSSRLIGPLIRFFTHLILVLRIIGQPIPIIPSNAIIQAYLQILEREGRDPLIAMYAACLREGSGEESYARFLRCQHSCFSKGVH